MWDGATAPAGWGLCDGSGGRPDIRDYFLRIGTTGNHGTTAGDNSCTFSGSLSGHSAHNHALGSSVSTPHYGSASILGYAMANHTASQIKTILQNYHALNFIAPL